MVNDSSSMLLANSSDFDRLTANNVLIEGKSIDDLTIFLAGVSGIFSSS